MLESNLPKTFWTYAVMTSVHIQNRCFNPRLGKTTYETFTGRKPNVSNMHVFGTVCFAHVQSPKKLDARSEQGIFIGYDKESPAFLVYFHETGKVRKVRCVKFTDKYENIEPNEDDWARRNVSSENYVPQEANDPERCTDDVPVQEPEPGQEPEPVTEDGNRRYPSREHRKPKRYGDYVLDESAKYTVDYCFRVADVLVR